VTPTLDSAERLPFSGGALRTAEPLPFSTSFDARKLLVPLIALTAIAASTALLLPALSDLPDAVGRVAEGSRAWLTAALAFEIVSFYGHILLFEAVLFGTGSRIGMRESYEITMAGHAATRLFASAGAGGVALTAWAMRRSGMERHEVASRMVTFLVLLYSVYMAAMVVAGLGLWVGLFPGDSPAAMTLAPAALGAFVIAFALSMPLLGGALERRLRRAGAGDGRPARVAARTASAPAALASGVRSALHLVRTSPAAVAGALLWWGADIAVLWAAFEAFGAAPPVAVLVLVYFVGMLGNLLPLPGGVGGVDGGMIGAALAFGVDPSLAVVAVLAYRVYAFWLPILPGAVAFFQLRRTVARWSGEDVQPAAAAA
jgi:uncharacterized protein (TIRG00374 family)